MALLKQLYNTSMHFSPRLKSSFYQIAAILLCCMVTGVWAERMMEKNKGEVIATTRLDKAAEDSENRRLPILLVFSSTTCPYCKLQEEEILKPMLISGDYDNKVIIRKVLVPEELELIDFNGRMVSMDDFISHYRVQVTPTIVFLDHNGKELAKRLVGINTVEMFGSDVDDAIELSLKKLQK
ncbi:MAG: thioredoxin fold domain-containing protein [Gammaproteobacteria bacterium]|nr:thioredoxin fold domain-containing protein [Gammaproteobacteria bacterium]